MQLPPSQHSVGLLLRSHALLPARWLPFADVARGAVSKLPVSELPVSDLDFPRPVADVATGVVLPSGRRAQMLAILAQACLQAVGSLVSYFADLSPRRQRLSDLDFSTPVADVATGVVHPSVARGSGFRITRYGVTRFRISISRELSLTWPRGWSARRYDGLRC